MKVYTATYTDSSGYGRQRIFKTRGLANFWLKKQWERDFSTEEVSFKEWCEYGAWTGKIKQHTIE